MLLTVIFAIVIVFMMWWMRRDPLSHIPGPTLWQLARIYKPEPSKIHILMTTLKEIYGPIFKLPRMFGQPVLVLNDFDSIHLVSIKEGKVFGGRGTSFRIHTIFAGTGILNNLRPDDKWKILRKTSQRHIRQFGDGMSRLEGIIVDIAEDMFAQFENESGEPFNPKNIIFNTALNSIAFLIIGRRTEIGEPLVEKMREYEGLILKTLPLNASVGIEILDFLPWLRHFGLKSWNLFLRTLQLEAEIWQTASDFADKNPDAESICKVFREYIGSGNSTLTEQDAVKTTLSLLLAGVATTSSAFYAALDILAHHQDIQAKLLDEVQTFEQNSGRVPTLQDRPNMHYTRAFILEVLRYANVAPFGVPHQNTDDAEIQGYKIPAGTDTLLVQWNLHTDGKLWNEPFQFNPDRFLDDLGQVVPVDHPNRKHLMPFGAGPRVCLGETLAQTRLYLWVITAVQRFKIHPAPGNEPCTADPRQFQFEGVLRAPPYELILNTRE